MIKNNFLFRLQPISGVMPTAPRMIKKNAKYGDESIYFDLDDMTNTAGSWDMYGQDDSKRYPSLQKDFFERAGKGLARRDAMLAFCSMSGVVAATFWGAKGSRDVKLPITIGPQQPPQVGPRGRI